MISSQEMFGGKVAFLQLNLENVNTWKESYFKIKKINQNL